MRIVSVFNNPFAVTIDWIAVKIVRRRILNVRESNFAMIVGVWIRGHAGTVSPVKAKTAESRDEAVLMGRNASIAFALEGNFAAMGGSITVKNVAKGI